MPRQIYRFEIQQEVARSGGNIIHSARDTMDGSTVQLYEWNPGEAESKPATEAIAAASKDLDGAEIFSDRSTYYLAIQPENAKTTLAALRPQGLFSGPWPGLFEEPPPLPQAQPKPTVPPPPPKKGVSELWIVGTVLFGAATGILLAIMQASVNDLNQRINRLDQAKSVLDSDLTAQQQSYETLQDAATKTLTSMFQDAEAQQISHGASCQTVTVHKCGTGDERFAIRYKSLLGKWVTRGWFVVKGGETISFKATSQTFYLYTGWTGEGVTEKIDVVMDKDFIILDQQPSFGKAPEAVTMYKWDSGVDIGCQG